VLFEDAATIALLSTFLGLLCFLLIWGVVLRPRSLGEADSMWHWIARAVTALTGLCCLIGIMGTIRYVRDGSWIEVIMKAPAVRWGRRTIARTPDPVRIREFTVGPRSDVKEWVLPPYHLLAILADGTSRRVLETWETSLLSRARALASRLNELLVAEEL